MNILKINDILLPSEFKMSKFFNEQLKGKYAYWVKMRYIFPLESLDYNTYIKYEQLDEVHMLGADILPHIDLYSEEYCMIDFVNIYIDICETERINSVCEYMVNNEYVTDEDLDVSKLRIFRSWLADQLLFLNTGINGHDLGMYTSEQNHMLNYYKNDMYNDTVNVLSIFGKENSIQSVSKSSCGCCNSISDNIYNLEIKSLCDALNIYRKNIHDLMVETFRNVDFWSNLNKDFIGLFKKYIDNIIKVGFVIDNANKVIISCECAVSDTSNNEKLLKNLSIALEYILNDNVIGHKNFISDALYNWAEYLYDYMSWKIN
jgi:hypothetical protein